LPAPADILDVTARNMPNWLGRLHAPLTIDESKITNFCGTKGVWNGSSILIGLWDAAISW